MHGGKDWRKYPPPSDEAAKQLAKPASGQVIANPTGGEGV